jgi:hypothetical protein
VSGICDFGYETSGSIKCGEYILATAFTNRNKQAEF